MSKGVFVLVGTEHFKSLNIIRAYSDRFHMPYISPSLSEYSQHLRSGYQLHMKPPITKALVTIIKEFGWKNFHYVYDSEEGKPAVRVHHDTTAAPYNGKLRNTNNIPRVKNQGLI